MSDDEDAAPVVKKQRIHFGSLEAVERERLAAAAPASKEIKEENENGDEQEEEENGVSAAVLAGIRAGNINISSGKLKVSMVKFQYNPIIHLSCVHVQTTGRPPSVSGAIVDWNLSFDLLFFIEEIEINNPNAILLQNADFDAYVSIEAWKKMLTESCVPFLSPSCAVLNVILWDEYFTLAVGSKEGDKTSSSWLPVHDLVHFKLQLMPNYLISYLKNTGCWSTSYVSMPSLSESSILSWEKWYWSCKTSFLNMIGAKFSTKGIWGMPVNPNPPVSVKTCAGQGWGSELTTVMIRWLVDLDRHEYLKCLWSRIYRIDHLYFFYK